LATHLGASVPIVSHWHRPLSPRRLGVLSTTANSVFAQLNVLAGQLASGFRALEDPVMPRWPVDPVRAAGTPSLPAPGGTAVTYEMKWDGFRAIIWRTATAYASSRVTAPT
jgi:hypothetical protein